MLASPALNFTLKDLTSGVETIRQEKLPKEQPEEDLETKEATPPSATVSDGRQFYYIFIFFFGN